MSEPKKIKIIKRQTSLLPPVKHNLEGLESAAAFAKKTEREITRQVNNWVLDWQEQKRRQLKGLSLFN